jgi:modulator of FtsH protease
MRGASPWAPSLFQANRKHLPNVFTTIIFTKSMDTFNANASQYSFTPQAIERAGEARLTYIRKVYAYFGLGIVGGIAGALISMNTSLVFFVGNSPIIGFLVLIGMSIFAAKSSTHPTRAVPTLVAFTFVSGVIFSPTFYAISHHYIPGTGVETIYDALFMTSLVFGALTAYVFITKKDFSYMGASLMIGLFLVIGVSVVNLFIQSSNMSIAVAAVTVVLFSGFILFDTSRILKNANTIPPTLGALNLYLDFLNLFMALLQLLTGGRRR